MPTTDAVRVFLGVGSNVEPEANLSLCIRELRRRYGELLLSPVYRNKPVGFDGADFLNLVVGLETHLPPATLQADIESIHALAGRTRGGERFSSRPLDIDLLLYGDQVSDEPGYRVPRSDVLRYSFVLRPLADIVPDLVHPVTGRTLAWHWAEFDDAAHPLDAVDLPL